MSYETLVAYWSAIAGGVALVLNLFVKPLLEMIPFANPAQKATYNNPAHDALIRGANVLLNVVGVLILASVNNQLTLSNWLSLSLQVAMLACGSHTVFAVFQATQESHTSGVDATVATALNAAIPAMEATPAVQPAPAAAPLHQQAFPVEGAAEPPTSQADAQSGALDTPTQPVPAVSPISAPASAI